ncbi:ABC transporter permease subunit [Cryptosporangium arvum]|uniref:ABC transporter permease subunit n=1 Tax=Cryptosporangium arvum TaxID=80871 RepID=UPI0004B8F887|nr:ABC transporter permease subunit [Cryptosporangium arvum]
MIRAEWTKLRTVRGWVAALAAVLLVIVVFSVAPGAGGTCDASCRLPTGPAGQEVTDAFRFVHRTLPGDGSITARITSFTGERDAGPGRAEKGLVPWAKAGLIVKDGTEPGSSYAAVMLTGAHGVRMQYDYVHDVAGPTGGPAPQWLRLTRDGATITAAASPDGRRWTTVGTATPDLPATVEVGLFVASPQYAEVSTEVFGVSGATGGPSTATAVFDEVQVAGTATAWTTQQLGGPSGTAAVPGTDADPADDPRPGPPRPASSSSAAGGVYTLTGNGDVAPAVSGANGLGSSITQTLAGTFVALILLVVVGAMFVTAEYRRGLLAVTLAAAPRRSRVLTAKAVVIGGVAAVIGTVAAAIAVPLGTTVMEANGLYVNAAPTSTVVRAVLGTGLLLALCAVFALAIGTVVRRGAVALTAVLGLTVLPYLLSMSVLPARVGDWVLAVTPAAAFAVQQSAVEYPFVDNLYVPSAGYFPLPPAGGLAVLLAWTAVAFTAAVVLLGRRDVR